MKRIFINLTLACLLATRCLPGVENGDSLQISEVEILEQTEVRFPAAMRALGIKEGKVVLVLSISPNGELLDSFVLESTQQAFAKSALKSISEWKFAPAQCNGEPILSSIRVDLNFQVDRRLAWQMLQAPVETNITQSALEEGPITAADFGDLDSIPLPLDISEPNDIAEGNATIEFYIDELGYVRCPRLTKGNSFELGLAMLKSVASWRFQSPVAEGARTNTMVRQTFTYQDGTLSAAHADDS